MDAFELPHDCDWVFRLGLLSTCPVTTGIGAKKDSQRRNMEAIGENLIFVVVGDNKLKKWSFLSAIKRRYLENRKGHPRVAFSVLCRYLLVYQFKVYATIFGFTSFSFIVSQRQFLTITNCGHTSFRNTTSRKVTFYCVGTILTQRFV